MDDSTNVSVRRHGSGRRLRHCRTNSNSGDCYPAAGYSHTACRNPHTSRWYSHTIGWYTTPPYFAKRNISKYNHSWFYLPGLNARLGNARIDISERHAQHDDSSHYLAERLARNDDHAGIHFAEWNAEYHDAGNHAAPNDTSGEHAAFNNPARGKL